MPITTLNHGMLMRALVILAGVTLGLADTPGVQQLPLALLCLSIGGLLAFAFRANPGQLCQTWQQYRRSGPHALFVFYAQAGPWLCRFGAGLLAGLLIGLFIATT